MDWILWTPTSSANIDRVPTGKISPDYGAPEDSLLSAELSPGFGPRLTRQSPRTASSYFVLPPPYHTITIFQAPRIALLVIDTPTSSHTQAFRHQGVSPAKAKSSDSSRYCSFRKKHQAKSDEKWDGTRQVDAPILGDPGCRFFEVEGGWGGELYLI